jgi:hypothetical protein
MVHFFADKQVVSESDSRQLPANSAWVRRLEECQTRKSISPMDILSREEPAAEWHLYAARTRVTLHLNPGILPLCYQSMSGI